MARSPYSLNSYVGGASPAALLFTINNSTTTVVVSGTNSSWNTLGSTGGFFLALNYGTVTEEKIWVPSGTYNWSSPPVTLNNVQRNVDGTSAQNLNAGDPVVPILTGIDLQEANLLVAQILGSGTLIAASGQAVISTGAGITYGTVAPALDSISGPGLTNSPGAITQSGGFTVWDTTSSGINLTTSGTLNISTTSGITIKTNSNLNLNPSGLLNATTSSGINLTTSGNFSLNTTSGILLSTHQTLNLVSSGNMSLVSSGNITISGASITLYPAPTISGAITHVVSSGGTILVTSGTGPTVSLDINPADVVTSFEGRTGAVSGLKGDYTGIQVGNVVVNVNWGSNATPTFNTDMGNIFSLTGGATNITSMTTSGIGQFGTPTHGQCVWFEFTDNGTARSITWGAGFRSTTVTLPTTTTISAILRVACTWNTVLSTFDCIGVA